MGLARVTTETDGQIFSPFSGRKADGEAGPNRRDRTLLFVYYGDAGEYGFLSRTCRDAALRAGAKDPETLPPLALARKLRFRGGLVIEVNAGWNGMNYYAFAPLA